VTNVVLGGGFQTGAVVAGVWVGPTADDVHAEFRSSVSTVEYSSLLQK
jgi:hypothetical protein